MQEIDKVPWVVETLATLLILAVVFSLVFGLKWLLGC